MSLRIWLPLQGNFSNQGLANVTPVLASGNSWIDGGKIGGKTLKMTKRQTISTLAFNGKKQFSFAYWVKVNEAWSKQWLDGIRWNSVNEETGESTTNRQEFYTNCTKCGFWYAGTDDSNSISNKSFTPGVWTHFAGTVDYINGKTTFYKNGILQGTKSNVNTLHYITNIYIGDDGVDISMNDLRLYDHILSAEEIREIVNGLVLHYKLDGAYGYPTNFLPDTNVNTTAKVKGSHARYFESASGGTYTAVFEEILDPPVPGIKYGIHQTVTVASGFHSLVWYSGANVSVTIGIPHTMSCYVKWISGENATLEFQYGKSPYRSTTKAINKDGQWHQYSWTFTPDSSAAASNTTKIYCGGLSTVGEILICGYKLERGTKATQWCEAASDMPFWSELNYRIIDSSGYGHHGTLTGTRRFASGSAKYDCCEYIANGATDYIQTPELSFPTDAITMNIWFKSINTAPTADYHMLVDSVSNRINYEMCVNKSGYFRAGLSIDGTRQADNCSSTTCLNGEWHMLTLTYDGATVKRYTDAVLESSTAATGTLIANDILRIGKDGSGDYACIDSYLSDFRIYCTALLDTEIKKLYNVSMGIDKNYNVHAFNFIENINYKVGRDGNVIMPTLYENGILEHVHYDKTIYTEPDGSQWVHVAHHNNPASSGLFAQDSDWEHGVYIDEDRWYDVEEIMNLLVKYEFMIKEKNTSSSTEVKYRWVQIPNPLTCTHADVKPDTNPIFNTDGYTKKSSGGLWKINKSTRLCVANNNNTSTNWFGAIGAWNTYSSGIPAYQSGAISSGYTDLYVRVYLGAGIIKNYGLKTTEAIER